MRQAIKPLPVLDPMAQLPMFSHMTEDERRTITRCSEQVWCEPGDTLFREGEPAEGFFILKRGRVKMRKISASGHEVILHLATPPNMIGCKALTMPGSSYPADAVVIEEVEAFRFTPARFMTAVAENPHVFFSLLIDLNRRLGEIYTVQAAALEPVEQRIATLLLQQALPEDAELDQWNSFPVREVRLTKTIIGSIVGTTTETAIRTLSRWKKKGLIDSDRGVIRLLKPGEIYRLVIKG